METVLSIDRIAKNYGPIQALKGVSFDVPKGSVFGVLGPNGSGKTTLLGTILNVLNATSGSYNWLGGVPAHEARKKIGSLLETPNFYHYLDAWDNLAIVSRIKDKGFGDRERVLQDVGLYERRHSKFKTYSLGMKQRLAIGSALLGNPDILVLDEPTNGLDPVGIAEIRDLIRRLNNEGKTIIMASHLLDEVEKVCTHVAILKKGDLLVTGKVDEVMTSDNIIELSSADLLTLEAIVSEIDGVSVKVQDGVLQVFADPSVTPAHINEYCMNKGVVLSHLALKRKSLETKFMELTNN